MSRRFEPGWRPPDLSKGTAETYKKDIDEVAAPEAYFFHAGRQHEQWHHDVIPPFWG